MMQGTEGYFEVGNQFWPVVKWSASEGKLYTFDDIETAPMGIMGGATLAGHGTVMCGDYPPQPICPTDLIGKDAVWAVLKEPMGERLTFRAVITFVFGPWLGFESVGSYAGAE